MTKEKQIIEEMARVLCEDCARDVAPCSLTKSGRMCDSVREQAEALYNADYRKQSEGEWLDTGDEQLDKIYSSYKCSVCGFIICGHSGKYCSECGAKMKGGTYAV